MQPELRPQGRELPGHGAKSSSGEYVVYHFWAKSFVRCTPDGEMLNGNNEMGYVFDNLSAAQQYCQWKVNDKPEFACTIYDSNGKAAGQIFSRGHLERAERASSPKRQVILGSLSLIGGCLLIWLDAKHDWLLIIGFLVGVRLAGGGVARLLLSATGLYKKRSAPAKQGAPDKLSG